MKMNRREFIRNGALAAAAVGLNPLFGGKSSRASAANTDKVVVVLNLEGGNDGLNTVIPLTSAEYDKYKNVLRTGTLGYDQATQLGPTTLSNAPFALNPGMTAFKGLYEAGKLAVITGVSVPTYATGQYDHAAGQTEFQTCDVYRNQIGAPTGWLGRFLDSVTPGQVTPGIDLGGGRLMLTGNSHLPVSISSISDFKLQTPGGTSGTQLRAAYDSVQLPVQSDPVAEVNRVARQQARAQSILISNSTNPFCNADGNPQPCEAPMGNYPDTWLGFQMREAARIILADIGARALAIGTGGYDTHSGQNTNITTSSFGVQNQTLPYHEYLLKNVAESVKALYDDLAAHGASGRVVIVTFSEFGRTVYENTDGGTDHGFGSCAFAVGDVVNGQNVYGTYPSLLNLYQGDSLKISNDFRNVYATILANFFGADPGLVDTNDGSYSPAPIAYI